jgi:hypothetical protein
VGCDNLEFSKKYSAQTSEYAIKTIGCHKPADHNVNIHHREDQKKYNVGFEVIRAMTAAALAFDTGECSNIFLRNVDVYTSLGEYNINWKQSMQLC